MDVGLWREWEDERDIFLVVLSSAVTLPLYANCQLHTSNLFSNAQDPFQWRRPPPWRMIEGQFISGFLQCKIRINVATGIQLVGDFVQIVKHSLTKHQRRNSSRRVQQ
jgi:hypothetical protein